MTLDTLTNKPVAGQMARGKQYLSTYTTLAAAGGAYEVIGTFPVSGFPGIANYISVADNDLLFKFEYTRDGVNWHTSVEDYPIAAAATGELFAQRNAMLYRVSVKPAAFPGAHGTATWYLTLSDFILPSDFRGAFGYEALTITNAAAVALTQATYEGALKAEITVEDNNVRYRLDGTDPTTIEGHELAPGDILVLDFTADIFNASFIAEAGDAVIRVTYLR